MTDLELLKAAAKAVKFRISNTLNGGGLMVCSDARRAAHKWNPLASNSDAFMLAAMINADVCFNICFCEVLWVNMETSETFTVKQDWGARDVPINERMKHARRAIVLMASKVTTT